MKTLASASQLQYYTLIVNVARSWEIGVALGRATGIARPALPSTVAKNRAC